VVAILQDELTAYVARGENARKRLRHDAVAPALEEIASMEHGALSGEFATEIPLDRSWAVHGLRVVAFLQYDRSRHVVGAAASDLE
jgi:hypothetical protein